MADVKYIEVRDRLTFVPCLAIRLSPNNERERYLASRAGFGVHPEDQAGYVLLTRLGDHCIEHDPIQWADRTMQTAHQHIAEHWDSVPGCGVVDVEYLRGETSAPKLPEGSDG